MAKSIDINISISDDGDLQKVKKQLQDIGNEKPVIDMRIDGTPIKNAEKQLRDIDGNIIDLDVNVDDSQVQSTKKDMDDMKGDKIPVDVNVDDSEIKAAQKEIDNLKSSVSSASFGMGTAISGIAAGLAGKSIWDLVYGTSAKAETNKILIKNMGDLETSSEKLYDTIDKTTDSSLISMQQLIPALNGIKSATGASATEIDNASSKVASFGQYVYAMTGSEAKAEQAMFDLSKGIKGAYASLDQYGITEDALKRTKLWSGKEKDLNGYLDAVNEVTGSTGELMGTATGMEALMGKAFSRAGKKIGKYVLPQVKNLLKGFNELDESTDGWLSTSIVVTGGVASSLVGVLSAISQVSMGLGGLSDGMNFIGRFLSKTNTGTFWRSMMQGPGILGKLTAGYNALAISEYIALGPLLAIIAAIILIGIAIYEIGKYLGWWNDFGTMLDAIKAGLMRLWSAFINNPDVQGFIQTLKQAWADLSKWISSAWTEVSKFLGISQGGEFDAVRAIIDIIGIAWAMLRNKIMFVINAIKLVISVYQAMNDKAKWAIDQVVKIFQGAPDRIRKVFAPVTDAITAPFQKAYNTVKPLIDGIVGGGHSIGLWGFDEYEGFNNTISYEGFDSSLNESIMSSNTKTSPQVINNFYIEGIIEEEASEYIVNSVNNHIRRQNLLRGI